MQASGDNRGGRQTDMYKGMSRSRSRTESTRSPWRTAGWTRGATIIFGHKRSAKGPKPQSRREIMKEITRKVLADERTSRKGRKTLTPNTAPQRTAPYERTRDRSQERSQDRSRERSQDRRPERTKERTREQTRERTKERSSERPRNPQTASAAAPEASTARHEGVTLIRPRRGSQTLSILALRVTKGLHAGALTPLTTAGVLMIGSAEDCDVILADPGVQAHHCLLTIQDGKVAVRAVDGTVKLGGQEHAPGSAIGLELEAAVALGEAEFEVTAKADAPKKESTPSDRPTGDTGFVKKQLRGTAKVLSSRAWAAGAVAGGVVAIGALVVVLALVPRQRTMWVPAPVAASATPAPALNDESRILRDVTEVLRLQGIGGELIYSGDGAVTLTGHLGDPHALEAAIRSRAMMDIRGLKRVVAVNLDHPGPTTGTSADRMRIVSAISGKDPFVVTADGSRYYQGATLPQGGKLAGVDGDEILIERDGKTEHLKLTDMEGGTAPVPPAKSPP